MTHDMAVKKLLMAITLILPKPPIHSLAKQQNSPFLLKKKRDKLFLMPLPFFAVLAIIVMLPNTTICIACTEQHSLLHLLENEIMLSENTNRYNEIPALLSLGHLHVWRLRVVFCH
jgi:hypothetical protein